jgi:hypothetical protein
MVEAATVEHADAVARDLAATVQARLSIGR